MVVSGLQPSYLQIPDIIIRIGEDHLLAHRMCQAHGAREHRRQEDMILWDGVNQILGVGHLPCSFHLLVDPEVRAEFEARLHHQFFVSQILIDA